MSILGEGNETFRSVYKFLIFDENQNFVADVIAFSPMY